MFHDAVLSLRRLLRSPGYATATIALLALGIGLNSGMVGVFEAIALRPMHLADDVVALTATSGATTSSASFIKSDVDAIGQVLRDRRALAAVSHWHGVASIDNRAEVLHGEIVSASYFDVFRVPLDLGPGFTGADDDNPAGSPVIISHRLWQTWFAKSQDVLGTRVRLEDRDFTIVGIASAEARGVSAPGIVRIDVWLPLGIGAVKGTAPLNGELFFRTFLRVDETDIPRLRPSLGAVADRLRRQGDTRLRLDVVPAAQVVTPPTVATASMTIGAVLVGLSSLLVVVVGANVTNLSVSRWAARAGELAVRTALGASRWSIIQLVGMDVFWITLFSAGAGYTVCVLLSTALSGYDFASTSDGFGGRLSPDFRMGPAALAAIAVTAIVVGVLTISWTMWRLSAAALSRQIGQGGGVVGGSSTHGRPVRSWLTVLQVAVTTMLVVAASLCAGAAIRVAGQPLGFDVDNQAIIRLEPGLAGYKDAELLRLYRTLLPTVDKLHDVDTAAVATRLPFDFGARAVRLSTMPEATGDSAALPTRSAVAQYAGVSSDFFSAFGLPIVRGRALAEPDISVPAHVAIVNESLARLLWPDGRDLGRLARLADIDAPDLQIVGVAADTAVAGILTPGRPYIYLPIAYSSAADAVLIARTEQPEAVANLVRRAVHDIDPKIPVTAASTGREAVGHLTEARRTTATFMTAAAALAVVVSLSGLYATLSQFVRFRRRELAIRATLGATRLDIVALVMRETLLLAAAGAFPGALIGYGAATFAQRQGSGIETHQPLAWLAVLAIVATVTALAAAMPSMAATRIGITSALREQ